MRRSFMFLFEKELYGMTKEEAQKKYICIDCKKTPTFTSWAGTKEYDISALCESCFDRITKEDYGDDS